MATPPQVGDAPPPITPIEPLRSDGGTCPRCGAGYEPRQEYCLECGLRLPIGHATAAPAGWRRRGTARAGSDWLWPVLGTALVAALASATVLVVRALDEDEPPPRFAEGTSLAIPTNTTPTVPTGTLPTVPTATGAVPTATVPTLPTPTTAPTTTAPPPGQLRQWPTGQTGWTVVLASLPASGGRAAATAKAKQAADAGLQEVGVLRSDEFASLHPGYFVVFSGVHASRGEAESALSAARASGYDAAYTRQIAS